MTKFSLGAGFFRRSGTGAEAARAAGHESGSGPNKHKDRPHDGTPLGDQSGRRRGAGQKGERSNRSESD